MAAPGAARTIRRDGLALVIELGETQAVIDPSYGVPILRHLGAPIVVQHPASVPGNLSALFERPRGASTLDADPQPCFVPEAAAGWMGRPGLVGHRRDGHGGVRARTPRFGPGAVTIEGDIATVEAHDPASELTLRTILTAQGPVLRVEVELVNCGSTAYHLDELTVTVPVPARAAELLHLTGRWSHEFRPIRQPWLDGTVSFDNRRGRTSHDRPPLLFAGRAGFGENEGEVWGCALGWSGNTSLEAEALADGTRALRLGARWGVGEVVVEPGGTFRAPAVVCAASRRGLNGVSQAFHEALRRRPQHPGPDRPRPVSFNTWEALYFDHDATKLAELVRRAARVGCERFVLDDGWFHGRRTASAGLGDWWVDEDVHPSGLGPLIDQVQGAGMEFGLWIEPEMVNRDSVLYRAHPEWALADTPEAALAGRDQLVLDLGRPEVRNYLFERLSRLLGEHTIGFVKWDMNRDLAPTSDLAHGSLQDHLDGVYELWDRLRSAHPGVEFESCASGGGRADLAILDRAERVWTSDSNDPVERQRAQYGFSMQFPPEVMGAHIGPPRSHTTGRTHRLGFRAATAMVGHLGIEWNLLEASDGDLDRLRAVVAIHRSLRPLLHGGTHWRLDLDDPAALASMVSAPDGAEAIVSFCQLDAARWAVPTRLRLRGLDPDRTYRVRVLPVDDAPWGVNERQVRWVDEADGLLAGGRSLIELGLQMPILAPESALLLHLVAQS